MKKDIDVGRKDIIVRDGSGWRKRDGDIFKIKDADCRNAEEDI